MLLAAATVGLFILPGPWNVVAFVVALVIEVAEIHAWRRYLGRRRVSTGAEGLVGERAEVIERCAPDGRVRLRGEIWRARSERRLEVGEQAEIVAVDGLTLEVKPR